MVQIIGRIYKIVSSECDGCYIGSTTQQLSSRFNLHKNHYKRYSAGKHHYLSSFEVLKFADAKIELIHEGIFDSKEDMETFEGETIRTTPNALNKNIAGRTRQEWLTIQCVCPNCGGKYTIASKARHFRSKKHQKSIIP